MQHYALIVAGGAGTRMGAEMPKQFLTLAGKPILMHTLEKFAELPSQPHIILALPAHTLSVWADLQASYGFDIPHTVVAGGDTRIASVRNGLAAIPDQESLVAIHDGVRPLVTTEIITQSYAIAEEKGSAVACVLLKDSIRYVAQNDTKALERSHYRLVQTPQTFQTWQIWEAYQQSDIEHLTDDASVWEASGRQVELIEGTYQNIKITTPEDLKVAEALLSAP